MKGSQVRQVVQHTHPPASVWQTFEALLAEAALGRPKSYYDTSGYDNSNNGSTGK